MSELERARWAYANEITQTTVLVTSALTEGRFVSPVGIYHCVGARSATEEQALRSAFEAGGAEDVCALRFDAHGVEASCWLHAPAMCLSRREPES